MGEQKVLILTDGAKPNVHLSARNLPTVHVPTLVLQCSDDVLAPVEVGEFVARTMPEATLVMLDATGHCPNLSAPEQTANAIAAFLRTARAA